MTSMSQDSPLDYTFARHFVTLRTTLGLTQVALAQQLGVTERAIQRWEGGTRYPKTELLKAFLALCIERHAFPTGQELAQARMLWKAARLKVLFDEHWVRGLLPQSTPLSPTQIHTGAQTPQSLVRPVDWGEEVSDISFYGREHELAQLTTWIQEDHCRLIAILGMGGIGKSTLAVTLLHRLAPAFSVAVFRSVRDAIPCDEHVADLIQACAPEPLSELPVSLKEKIQLLIEIFQTRRCLLVLDNVETLLQEGEQSGRYRVGYEGYGHLFERIGATQQQSCVVLTSREKPAELKALEGNRVRSLHLAGLDQDAGEQILAEKQVRGDAEARQGLIDAYSGNPLALKIVAETIHEQFAGEIAPFLAEGQIIFQGVRALLAHQFARLPFLAQSVLFWLAIVREPVDVSNLLVRFVTPIPRLHLLETLEDLRRRSLIEHGQQRAQFTLQSVVMEFVTDTLVKQIALEIQRREPDHLLTYALSLASTKEYIRQAQERLLLAPVLFHLGASQPRKSKVEQQLLYYLDLLRSYDLGEQGYGPTNIAMLLQHLKGSMQGVDLSRLSIREAYLQGIQMQDTSLNGSIVQASTFTEVFDFVTAVAVSGNGAYWAAGSNMGDVRIFWEESSTLLLLLQAHTSVAVIAFNPDGQTFATAGRDNLIKIWQLEQGILLATLHGHSQVPQAIAFSPDGKQLATCSLDGTIRIWDTTSFQLLHLIEAHVDGVSCVVWSPDGALLASAGDAAISVWNPQNGQGLYTLTDAENGIYGLAFSPDSQFLVNGGTDQLVKIWDVSRRVCLQVLRGHSTRIIAVVWSPDGRLIASGGYDTTIRIWQASTAVVQHVLLGHIDSIQSLAFNVDGSRLFSGSEDCSVRLWETASGQCVRLMQGYKLSCHSVAWHPHGDMLAAATSDARIILWHVTQTRPLHILQGHTQIISSVAWSPDGQVLASSSHDRTIRLWKSSTGECLAVLPIYADFLHTISWSPDGLRLAIGGNYEGTVYVWDREKERILWVGKGHAGAIRTVAWSPDGAYIASGSNDYMVRLWDAKDGTPLKVFEGHQAVINGISWNPDSTRLASCGGGKVYIWDIASGVPLQIMLDLPAHIFYAVTWSPQGERLLVGGRGGTIYWFETDSWTRLAVREEHQASIRSLAIRPDGRSAASADANGVIIIWDLEQMVPLRTLRPDRPYERLDITGIQGITEAQKMTLRALGAFGE